MDKKHTSKKHFLPLGILIVALLTVSVFVVSNTGVLAHISEKSEAASPDEAENIFASLSGFQPNTIVKYTVIGDKDGFPKAVSGLATTDALGNLTLPMPEELNELSSAEVKYNFLIDENNQNLNIALIHNIEDDTLSVEGSGTEKFTKITIESGESLVETRSDWAGSFEKNEISDILQEGSNEGYKIAFFNTAPGQDIQSLTRQPVIDIQFSPGGGGPTSTQVNSWTTGNCGSGPQPTYCNSSTISNQANDIVENLVEPLQLMAEQFSFNAMYQVFIIGTFFDAKEQLETQRDIQALTAEAHRDYHPSEQLCRFGSFTRSLAHTEQKMEHDAAALNDIMMEYYTNREGGVSGSDEKRVIETKLLQYRTKYCDPMDNGGGLSYLCEHDQDENIAAGNSTYGSATDGIGASDYQRMNKDIDYLRTFDTKYTLNVNFTDNAVTDDEEDIIALAKNLYWPSTYKFRTNKDIKKANNNYMNARRLITLQNLAHNSFAQASFYESLSPHTRHARRCGLGKHENDDEGFWLIGYRH